MRKHRRASRKPGESPVSVAIRAASPSDARAIAQVRIDCWRATYRGLVPDAYLASMDVEPSAAMWERVLSAGPNTASVFVAERDGQVVGFAAGHMLNEPRYELNAELTAVYLRREYQRAGIGTRLVDAVAKAQRAHGANGLVAWVIAGNKPARGFYEELGATLLVEQPFEWDGLPLIEAGYGFSDIDALIRACETSADRAKSGGPTLH
ncbi:MAG TPA: GNAT family N-acetyltransferase [Casimicrobiaceae bacterium]|nr:GNAT family N-acetyltransferase [Casimicrobiaceae bacterium]